MKHFVIFFLLFYSLKSLSQKNNNTNFSITGEYYCGDKYSTNRVIVKKTGESYSFIVTFHSEINTDYGGHLFEHEDVFEKVFQMGDETICEYSIGEGCKLTLEFMDKTCKIGIDELGDCLYPVKLNECILQKVN